MVKKPNKDKLQRLINAAAKGHTMAYRATSALDKYCETVWGFAPSDRDCDLIIDSCLGGCGASTGMPAGEFIDIMNAEVDDEDRG